MAQDLFINISADDVENALVTSLTDTTLANLRDLVMGDDDNSYNIYFVDSKTGEYASWSGDATYTVRAGVGVPGDVPTGGTFTITFGANTTAAIAFDASAATVQTALNAIASIQAAGNVTVTGESPAWVAEFNTAADVALMTATSSLLTPDSSCTVSTIRAGSVSVKERQLIRLARDPIASQDTFSAIDDGFNGVVDPNTYGVLDSLIDNGFADLTSCFFEIEVTNPSGKRKTYLRKPIRILAEVIDRNAASPTPLASYLTTSETLAAYVGNRSAVTGLTGGGSTNLDGITTVGVAVGLMVAIKIGDALSVYKLEAGTDAESSPTVIRPDDFHGTTNQKVWKLATVESSADCGYHDASFNTAGNTDVAPGAAFIQHTEQLTPGTGAGTYTRTVSLLTANASGGELIFIHFIMPASANPTIEVRNATSGGTLLSSFTGTSTARDVIGTYYFNGTAWKEFDIKIKQ